jgi:hypothetical protein
MRVRPKDTQSFQQNVWRMRGQMARSLAHSVHRIEGYADRRRRAFLRGSAAVHHQAGIPPMSTTHLHAITRPPIDAQSVILPAPISASRVSSTTILEVFHQPHAPNRISPPPQKPPA